MIKVYFDAIVAPPFNAGVFRLYLLTEARRIASDMRKDFERTTKTWGNKPKFEAKVGFGAQILDITVGTDDENYRRVVQGTPGKPRVAVGSLANPGKPRALTIFPYIPKTIPGQIDAKDGGVPEGSAPIFRRYALNAGKIAPRNFDLLIQDIWKPEFPKRFQEALENAAAKTGYSI